MVKNGKKQGVSRMMFGLECGNKNKETRSRYIKVHGQFSCSWTFYLHYFYYCVTYSDSK